MPRLNKGDIFLMPGTQEEHEVLYVTDSSAFVRPVKKRRVNGFETRNGKVVEAFERKGDAFHISANSGVEVVR